MNFMDLIFLSYIIKCSVDDKINTDLESLQISNELLYFSFDKATFSNFRCNLDNKILTHRLLDIPPFYITESIRNFIYTFCYFFQYSEIMTNNQFKKKIEKLYKSHLKDTHRLKNKKIGFKYDKKLFDDLIEDFSLVIKNILEEKNENIKMIVNIEEKEGRIIITPKYSTNDYLYKILKDVKAPLDMQLNKVLEKEFINFHIKFHEMYLQGFLGASYTDAFEIVTSKKTKEPLQKPKNFLSEFENLRKLFFRTVLMIKIIEPNDNISTLDDAIENARQKAKIEFALIVDKLFPREDIPIYFKRLVVKSSVKSIIGLWNNTVKEELYTSYPADNRECLISFTNILMKSLATPTRIVFTKEKLSDKSLINLVKQCLELIV